VSNAPLGPGSSPGKSGESEGEPRGKRGKRGIGEQAEAIRRAKLSQYRGQRKTGTKRSSKVHNGSNGVALIFKIGKKAPPWNLRRCGLLVGSEGGKVGCPGRDAAAGIAG